MSNPFFEMSPEEITHVKRTWRLLRQVDPALLGELFMARLQIENPHLGKLYNNLSGVRYDEAMRVISTVVARLEQPETLHHYWPIIVRYFGVYGITPLHYHSLTAALLWSLRQGLGRDWSAGVEQAWRQCCCEVCEELKRAG